MAGAALNTVREARMDDLGPILGFDHLGSDPGRRVWLEVAIRQQRMSILERDGQVIAYGVLEPQAFFGRDFVSLLYVAESARRQGAASTVLQHLESRCATPQLFSSTNLSNAPMHELFRKLGYISAGMIHELDEGDPEVIYVKAIPKREPLEP